MAHTKKLGFDNEETVVAGMNESAAQERSQSGHERRQFERYAGRLRVVLVSGSVVFRTFSFDVSEGGLRLEQAPPLELLQGPVDVYISNPSLQTSLKFKARLVGHQREPLRFQFIAQNANSALLKDWVQSFKSRSIKRSA